MIIWATNNVTRKRAPLDAEPWEEVGNIMLHDDGRTYQILEAELAQQARERQFPLYTNHLATCPAHER